MRPKVLVTISHYHPGYKAGGPIRSIGNLVDNLSAAFDFGILTSDRDLGESTPYAGIEADRWLRRDTHLVNYLSPANLSARRMRAVINQSDHDLIYLNSLFSRRFSILPLVLRRLGLLRRCPVVIAPRGEFSAGALAIRKPRKMAFIAAAKASGFFDGLVWQASTELERRDIELVLGSHAKEIRVAGNLPTVAAEEVRVPPRATGEALRIVFLSRISEKKNLDYALEALKAVRSPVVFDIYGPREDQRYARRCEDIARALPPHIEVRWHGAIPPDAVAPVLAAHDLLFFPTRGENYGQIIAEALSVGTPVLISDRTPWRGLGASGVGHDLPLEDRAAFAARIDEAAARSTADAMRQRLAVRAFFGAHAERRREDVERQRALFVRALELGGR